ncbi:hypothetical protein GCM10027169_28080 [Gordonia jinhuaensis]|uniref:Uncharacterized protein n=1 Tax=Gordonia jinhuaensis TaxID=1517702 RepID=A0A916T9L5_9ACTN|nr:hypothetical protein GCM10011489_26050 [Gordonia jinhuaensis]
MGISMAEVQKWNPDDIAAVFGISSNIADHASVTALRVSNLPAFESWTGDAAKDATEATEKTKKALELHGKKAQDVADAARAAEIEVVRVKASLKNFIESCDSQGFTFDPVTDTITPIRTYVGPLTPDEAVAAQRQAQALTTLEKSLLALEDQADCADKALAEAIAKAAGLDDVKLMPSETDVVLGSAAALTAAKTDIIADIWRAEMGEAPTGLEAKVLPWLEEISDLGTSKIGVGMGAVMAVPMVFADMHEHESFAEAATREATGVRAGFAASKPAAAEVEKLWPKAVQVFKAGTGVEDAAEAGESAASAASDAALGEAATDVGTGAAALAEAGEGAADGAALGSVIPGAGTALGAVVGAAVGGIAAYAGSKLIQELW